MPLSINDFINILAELCEEKNLKCTVKGSLKGGFIAGTAAALGGLLFGPVGLAIGGALGGATAAIKNSGQFQSVAVVLKNLSYEQKTRLYNKIKHAFQDFGPQDVAALAALLMSTESLKTLAIKEVTNYLTLDMNINIH